MDILSLSVSVVHAHNTNNADLFAITCSQLEDAVMDADFISQLDSEHCYIIGRALYYCFFYNNRYNPTVSEQEILKRIFLCLTKALFIYKDAKIYAAKLLFITFYWNEKSLNQLIRIKEDSIPDIRNEYILDYIKGIIRESEVNEDLYCLETEEERKFQQAINDYESNQHNYISMNEGEHYIDTCYNILYNTII